MAMESEAETYKKQIEVQAKMIVELKRRCQEAEEKTTDVEAKLAKKSHRWSSMSFHPFASACTALGWYASRSPNWSQSAAKRYDRVCGSINRYNFLSISLEYD